MIALTARERILLGSSVIPNGARTPCWIWRNESKKGYGAITVAGRKLAAHRVSYEQFVGPIPDALVLDHLCRIPRCVNPAHLEPVTPRENVVRGIGPTVAGARMAAKTLCPHGHAYTAENLIRRANGARQCRECNRLYCARRGASSRDPAASGAGGGQGA